MPSSDLEQKAKFSFYQILGIGITFFALIIFLILKVYPTLFSFGESMQGKFETLCGCASHLSFTNHPYLLPALILLALGTALFLGFIFNKFIKLKLQTARFIRAHKKNKKTNISIRLGRVAKVINLTDKIIEIDDNSLVVFCFGFMRPRVCISSGLIEKLSDKELEAVLLHEQHHLLQRDPVKIFIVKFLAGILFFVPGFGAFSKQYLTFSELAADEWATNNFRDKVFLAKALSKVLVLKQNMVIKKELALSFFANQVIDERINTLVDSTYRPKFKIFASRLSVGFFVLIFSFLISSDMLVANIPVMSGDDMAYCLDTQSSIVPGQQCEMLMWNDFIK